MATPEDVAAVEEIREKWCSFLGLEMDGRPFLK